jgi:hypothetical protein
MVRRARGLQAKAKHADHAKGVEGLAADEG